jgi:hypothetical protein
MIIFGDNVKFFWLFFLAGRHFPHWGEEGQAKSATFFAAPAVNV